MKIRLSKEEKLALLQAASVGLLDTRKIARIVDEIRGCNPFLELMMQLDEDEAEQQEQTKQQ